MAKRRKLTPEERESQRKLNQGLGLLDALLKGSSKPRPKRRRRSKLGSNMAGGAITPQPCGRCD